MEAFAPSRLAATMDIPFATRLFDDYRRVTSQTDKSKFCSAAAPVAELGASLNHMRRDLQFLRNDILSLSWRGVGETSTSSNPFRSDSPPDFDSLKNH